MDHSTDHMHVKLPAYNPSYFLSNGSSGSQLFEQNMHLLIDQQTYVRVANMGYYGNRITFPSNVSVTIIDSDGRPLPKPILSDTLYMFPGERYGFLIEANAIHSDSFKVEYLDMNTLSSKGELFLKYSVVDDLNIEDIQKSELSIYPNPSGGELNVSLKNSSQLLESIHIRSLDGRLVYLSNRNGQQGIYKHFAFLRGLCCISTFEYWSNYSGASNCTMISF